MSILKSICLILVVNPLINACKKDSGSTPAPDDIIYTSTCSIRELIWLADNNSVLINESCNSNIFILNTTTKVRRTWNFSPNLNVQRFYFTPDIPDKIFFTSLTRQDLGGFSISFRLYSLGLTNFDTLLIKDSITDNTFAQGYTGGGKKMVIRTIAGMELINLETMASQVLPVTGGAQAFSPDNSKTLFYQYNANPITNAVIHDQNCSYVQPISLAGNGDGKALWRTSAIMSYHKTSPFDLEFQNLQTGSITRSFSNYIAGPWISMASNHALLFVKGLNWANDKKGILVDYDFINNQTRSLVHEEYYYSSTLIGILLAAVSPDEKKLAYVVDGYKLKVISF
ncbi:MAG: hypothetical protein SGI83_04985 [Bacteroidota bacterium]|nr:hypothetical protein [Bacteroidota bacterium]